jgi:outer membrane protein TolC
MAGYDDSLSTYNSYQAGVVASVPLYDGNAIDSQTQKGKIFHLKAQEEYNSAQRKLYQELFDAYSDLQRSSITIESKKEIITSNTQALTLFKERYKQGLSTYIDVLESQNALDTGLAGLAEAHYQRIQSYAKIQKLLYQGDAHVNKN